MKRFIAISLAVLLSAGVMTGCGSAQEGAGDSAPAVTDEAPAAENNASSTESEAPAEESNAPAEESNATAEEGNAPAESAASTPDERLAERYEEPVTIEVVLGYRDSENPNAPEDLTPETSTAVKKLKELYNIDLVYSWIVNQDQFEAKFGAELAAGNLPDVMYITPNQFEDLYTQDGFADLTEAYEQYANANIEEIVNYDGQLLGSGMRDGKLYGLPMGTYPAQVTSQTYYRMDLIEKYGYTSYEDLPTTIAEFEVLADQLLADSNGEPIMTANKWIIDAGLSDFSPVFHAYEAWPTDKSWVDYGDGKLEYSGIHPNVKEAVTKLNEWYTKGYFPKDFAAMDVWGASTPAVDDVVAGKTAVVFGSWWIPNWPLNMNLANEPDAEWMIGPTLTKDGTQPKVQVSRYPINQYVAVSRDCENPEAVFKMMNWLVEYNQEINAPDFDATATEEQKTDKLYHTYLWLPFRVYSPGTLIANYQYLHNLETQGITTLDAMDLSDAPTNDEFSGALKTYLEYHAGDKSDQTVWSGVWGGYTSRVAEDGGVASMYELFTNSEVEYNELYITTPTMITKQTQLQDYKNSQIIAMIMGDVPVSEFDTFVEEWNNLGGNEIRAEVNEWYAGTK